MTKVVKAAVIVGLLGMVAVVGACAQPGPVTVRSYQPDDLVVRVEYVGGLRPTTDVLTDVPGVSVYGNGRVISAGPVPDIYPGPALPNLQLSHISPQDVSYLVNLAVQAGVGKIADYGQPNIMDAPSTRVSVLIDGKRQVATANALGMGDNDGQLTTTQRKARSDLRGLVDALGYLPHTLGPLKVNQQEPYVATRVAVVATPWTPPGENTPAQTELRWPGPTLPGQPVARFNGLTCLTVTDATAVLRAAAGANRLTPWLDGGQRWTIAFRPLLPDETDCDDLGD